MTEPRLGASEMMRELGLLVHGPAQWSKPTPSRSPGVFVVELPGAPETAPIDGHAVKRWIERVPTLTLGGERPSSQDLAGWLAGFWLPGEPILYVGRSARAISARLGAIYATPLGDSRPSAAGHWLRTLATLTALRVWWAETDAGEEYEDALLGLVAARNPAPGLPFGNLVGSADPKLRELAGSLLAPTEKTAPKSKTGAPPKPRRKAVRKAPATRKSATPREQWPTGGGTHVCVERGPR